MNPTLLAEILSEHQKWLNNPATGVRANLSGADLSGAKLYNANLYDADLSGANLSGANLYGANLSGANLSGANLSGANLYGADLSGANLSGAKLYNANLYGAKLYNANLSGANLSGANLSGAKLYNANLPNFQICPEEGTFIAYKKVQGNVVLKLRIEGGRTSSLVGRKCRTSKAFVLEAIGSDAKEFRSLHASDFIYRVGEYVEVPDYDPDIRIECTRGIHFFMTQAEAAQYGL